MWPGNVSLTVQFPLCYKACENKQASVCNMEDWVDGVWSQKLEWNSAVEGSEISLETEDMLNVLQDFGSYVDQPYLMLLPYESNNMFYVSSCYDRLLQVHEGDVINPELKLALKVMEC